MSLSKYEILIKVVEEGGLTRAGEKMNLTQSAVSRAIAGLEQELGLALLVRSRSGIRLTSDGQRLLGYFKAIVQANERLYQETARIKGLETGAVTIGTFSSVSIHWLPDLIKRFQDRFPLIEIKLIDGHYREIENVIAGGEADFGFVNLPTSLGLEELPLKRDRMLCILPEDHPLGEEDGIRPEQLEGEPFIMPAKGCDTDVRNLFAAHKLSPFIRFELEDDHAIMAMVQRGLGISILPEMIVTDVPYRLCIRPLRPDYYRSIGLAAVSLKNGSPAAGKFIDFVKEDFRSGGLLQFRQ